MKDSGMSALTRFSGFTLLIVVITIFHNRTATAQQVDHIHPSRHSIARQAMENITPSVDPDQFKFRLDQTDHNLLQQESSLKILSARTSFKDMLEYQQLFSQSIASQSNTPLNAPPPVTDFQGIVDNFTSIPPDTNGAVGPNHVVQMLNNGFQVFSKTGTPAAALISLQSFWAVLGTGAGDPASGPFDPKVLYDQYENRWVATADGSDGINSWVLVGITLTDDPTGGWNLFAIQANIDDGTGNSHTTHFADYPGFGLDPNNLVITNNMFFSNFAHADVWVVSKASLIAAAGPLVQGVDYALFHDPGNDFGIVGFTFQPTHTFGQTPASAANYLVDQGWVSTADDTTRFIRMQDITGVGASASLNTTGWYQVTGYNFGKLQATQPNCAVRIDTGDTRMLSAVVRNGKVWATHGVGIGEVSNSAAPSRAEIAWYEFDPAAGLPFPGTTPVQQGKISDPNLYLYYPSIAVNKNECVAVGFSGSDSSTFASAYYTLRLPTQPPGVMQPIELLKSGEGTYNKDFGSGRNRWGDYSGTVIDPVDDETFWTIQEYARSSFTGSCPSDSGVWGTWWGAFECGCITADPALSDPTGISKSRYLSLVPGNSGSQTAIRVILSNLDGFGGFNNQIRWVGPPTEYQEGPTPTPTFTGAQLQCDPYFQDWGSIDLLHVSGDEIVPGSSYDVQFIHETCSESLNDELSYSTSLPVNTGKWGDVIDPFDPSPSQPSISDILSIVDKWLGNLNPIKAQAQLQPNLLDPSANVGIADILTGVDAWLGTPYPFSGPTNCP